MASAAVESPRFVVAIDFGTARSGFAFGDFKAPDRVSTYDNFPGCAAGQKTRTDLLLNSDLTFNSFGDEATSKYTQLAENNEDSNVLFFSQFKMSLFDKDQLKMRPLIQPHNRPQQAVKAVVVIAACLRYMADIALAFANSQNVDRAQQVNSTAVLWVITVPAIWSAGGKQVMKEGHTHADK